MTQFLCLTLTSLLLCYNVHQVSTFLQSAIGLKLKLKIKHFFLYLYLFYYIYLVAEPIGPPPPTEKCPNNLATTCNLQCVNSNYALDETGCPICACASNQSIQRIGKPPNKCPLMKCRDNCGDAGYKSDKNGCRTCECASKTSTIECSDLMCRMHCGFGFSRDENGCEICRCNDSPQPCPQLNCVKTCLNGYKTDYSGKITKKSCVFKIKFPFFSRLSNM